MQAPERIASERTKTAVPATSFMQWTVKDYHRLVDSGVLHGRRVELIEGDLIEIAPEGPIHSYTTDSGADYLEQCFAGKANIREAHPITLATSEPEPDIAVVRLPRSQYKTRHPYPEDILLLVEISQSTLVYDLGEKKRLYAEADLQEYWVIDVTTPQLYIFRYPKAGDYSEEDVMTTGTIHPLAFPAIAVNVETLWQ